MRVAGGLGRGVVVAAAATLAVGVAVAHAVAPGDLDGSFGVNGTVRTAAGVDGSSLSAVGLQPDGKTVGFGQADYAAGQTGFALARYGVDGSLDSSFGSGGLVLTPFPGSSFSQAYSGAVLPDGRLLAAGQTVDSSSVQSFALARYHADGSLDTSFSGDGLATAKLGDADALESILRVLVQPDGKYMAVGFTAVQTATGPTFPVGLARFLPNGDLDPSFGGGDGLVVTAVPEPIGYAPNPRGAALDSSGRIVVAVHGPDNLSVAVLRYLPDGTIDASFGHDGLAVIASPSTNSVTPGALAIEPNGDIVVGSSLAPTAAGEHGLLLTRLHGDGTLDTSFGVSGFTFTPIDPAADRGPAIADLALQPDGMILAGGSSGSGNARMLTVVRYTPNGQLDPSFGVDGIVRTGFNDGAATIGGFALGSDGRLTAGGYLLTPGPSADLVLARYLTDTTAPACTVTFADAAGHASASFVFSDADTGLAQVTAQTASGAALSVSPFTPGDHEVSATAAQTVAGSPASMTVVTGDRAGNTSTCPSRFTRLARTDARGKDPDAQTFDAVPSTDHTVQVVNGTSGLDWLTIEGNGSSIRIKKLAPGEQRTINISSLLTTGANAVTFAPHGHRGDSAVVSIS